MQGNAECYQSLIFTCVLQYIANTRSWWQRGEAGPGGKEVKQRGKASPVAKFVLIFGCCNFWSQGRPALICLWYALEVNYVAKGKHAQGLERSSQGRSTMNPLAALPHLTPVPPFSLVYPHFLPFPLAPPCFWQVEFAWHGSYRAFGSKNQG